MVLAGVCGALAGVLGFIPFLLLTGTIRKRFVEKGAGILRFALLIPALSFILMIAAMVVCWWLAPGSLMVFAVTCIAVFLMGTIVHTVMQVRR
jgi:hypothetical protein